MTKQGDSEYDFSVVRALRNQAGVTLEEVAESTGVSLSTLARIEKNQNQPSLSTLRALAACFGLSPATLLAAAEPAVVEQVDEELQNLGAVTRRGVSFPDAQLIVGEAKAGDSAQRPHQHEGFYQLQWVLEGSMVTRIQGRDVTIGAGRAVRFDGGFEHAARFVEDTTYLVVLLPKQTR